MSKFLEDIEEEGFQEGFQKGFQEGYQESFQEAQQSAALRMLQAGKYSLEEISYISDLSLDEVKKISADKTA